ncbi:hypothetical protein AGLY_014628 [Aphis glycines]|uniref:Uncharacterized protein n=1 Tax=Aphis glycines TaxID=307491 RepID=A0A6G0T2E7_APHGL|nr:hypothetical protein AGLY_014628 [Aphis glycines]
MASNIHAAPHNNGSRHAPCLPNTRTPTNDSGLFLLAASHLRKKLDPRTTGHRPCPCPHVRLPWAMDRRNCTAPTTACAVDLSGPIHNHLLYIPDIGKIIGYQNRKIVKKMVLEIYIFFLRYNFTSLSFTYEQQTPNHCHNNNDILCRISCARKHVLGRVKYVDLSLKCMLTKLTNFILYYHKIVSLLGFYNMFKLLSLISFLIVGTVRLVEAMICLFFGWKIVNLCKDRSNNQKTKNYTVINVYILFYQQNDRSGVCLVVAFSYHNKNTSL